MLEISRNFRSSMLKCSKITRQILNQNLDLRSSVYFNFRRANEVYEAKGCNCNNTERHPAREFEPDFRRNNGFDTAKPSKATQSSWWWRRHRKGKTSSREDEATNGISCGKSFFAATSEIFCGIVSEQYRILYLYIYLHKCSIFYTYIFQWNVTMHITATLLAYNYHITSLYHKKFPL